jgi:hypothetical protein
MAVNQLNHLSTTISFSQEISLDNFFELVRQKITTISVFNPHQFVQLTTSYGYLIVIDSLILHPIYCHKIHKGNISSSCFVMNYSYFITASGSFSQNHDNSINVFKVCTVLDDIFFKKIHSFKNAHGRSKGVMNVVSSNLASDHLIMSCGNSDDGRIKIWNVLQRQVIFQFPEPASKIPYYNLNAIKLDTIIDKNGHKEDKGSPQHDDEHESNAVFSGNTATMVLVSSNRDVSMFEVNRDGTVSLSGPFKTDYELGTYLCNSFICRISDNTFRLFISNMQGNIETFDCNIETSERNSHGEGYSANNKLRQSMENSSKQQKSSPEDNNKRDLVKTLHTYTNQAEKTSGRRFSLLDESKRGEEGTQVLNSGRKIFEGLIGMSKRKIVSPILAGNQPETQPLHQESKPKAGRVFWAENDVTNGNQMVSSNDLLKEKGKDQAAAKNKSKTTSNE